MRLKTILLNAKRMKIKLALLAAMAFLSLSVAAQERKISGMVTDKETREPIEQATVQLLKTDSTYVAGVLTDELGVFKVKAPGNQSYLLKISSVGYQSVIKHVQIAKNRDIQLGNIAMEASVVMLKGATVTAQAMKVVMKEDTFVYNSAAYRTPEGSTIEELVKRLPGATIDDDGNITINGKQVKKILVDGKEFMTGDTKIALKNLPTAIIEKIKSYDEKSDLARVTGIDDGEETTVLDFGLKEGMHKGLFSNIDLAAGTQHRYAGRIMGSYFNSASRVLIFGNANNVNDAGFPGGGGRGRFGRGRMGLNATKMLGLSYNYEKKDKLELNLNAFWNHNNGDVNSRMSSENFVSKSGSFSNSNSQSYSRGDSWHMMGRMEWKPDTMTNIMFRPTLSWSTNDGRSTAASASFNEDPYLHVSEPLAEESLQTLSSTGLVVNSQTQQGITYGSDKNLNGTLQVNRKFGTKGRNVTLRVRGGYGKSDSRSLSTNATHLWLLQNAAGLDSTYQTNRYNLTPTNNYNYQVAATYSEPIFKGAFLQFRYSYKYSYSKSDRSTYDFSSPGEANFVGIVPEYRGWGSYLDRLSNPFETYLDAALSRFSEYKNYINEFNLTFRLIRPKYNLSVGVMAQPQKSKYVQDYQGVHVDTIRSVTNFAPMLNFRYRFNDQHQLRAFYRGTTTQPNMTQLLDITDDSNPLNISKGNPGLKPAFTHNFHLDYNNFISSYARFVGASMNFSATRNAISNRVSYDEETGGRTTMPENINGKWDIDGRFLFNTAIDTLGRWNISTETGASFVNDVGYVSLNRNSDSQRNRTQTLNLSETLSLSYRNNWLEVSLDGSLGYVHGRNKLQSQSNLDTWQFSYGGSVILNAPWGMSLATSIHENSRRGYSDSSMNTNELIWTAQLSQGFLKGKPLTVMLQFYDILHQQSNFSRALSAMQRSDTWYNSINSYAMLHVVYRFNLFGGKSPFPGMEGGEHGAPRGHQGMPPHGGRGFGGGHPRGGRF